jgi:ABC-type enterochelin transport system substrate-binding protein
VAATISEKYRFYYLHLLTEVMIDEMNELMRYGVSPLGVGYVQPLKQDVRQKISPLLAMLADRIRDATEKMIPKSTTTDVNAETAEDWMKIMLAELEKQTASVGSVYAHEREKVRGLLNQIKEILNKGKEGHEKK